MDLFDYLRKHIACEYPSDCLVSKIDGKLNFFSLQEYTTNCGLQKTLFLKRMQKFLRKDSIIDDRGSAVYLFRAGNAYLELDICVHQEIEISPYIRYHEESAFNDLHEIIEMDYRLHKMLKTYDLQK